MPAISRMSKSDTRRLAELREAYRDVYPMSDRPNLIIVDREKYLPFLIERATSEGFDIAKDIAQIPREWRDHVLLTSYEPVRLLTSLHGLLENISWWSAKPEKPDLSLLRHYSLTAAVSATAASANSRFMFDGIIAAWRRPRVLAALIETASA